MTTAVVIGAGLAGLQSAWYLQHEGIEVTLLERLDEVGSETSFANGGLMTPSHAAPWNSPGVWKALLRSIGDESAPVLFRPSALPLFWRWGITFLRNSSPTRFRETIAANAHLARRSVTDFHDIQSELDQSFEHRANGTMMIYRSDASLAQGITNARMMSAHGVSFRELDRAGVLDVEPALGAGASDIAGGIVFPDDESGNAHLYCRALANRVIERGADVRMGCEVRALRVEGGRVRAVETSTQTFEPDMVILAAGVFSPHLTRSLGINLPIRPVKGYSLTFSVEGWNQAPQIPVVDDDLHVGITPLGTRLRAVGSAEFTGYDKTVNPQRIAMLRTIAERLYPDVAPYVRPDPAHVEWAGLRPMTPDCLPIVGRTEVENLFLNTGHSYLGWTTGAATSRMVVDEIMGRDLGIDGAPYSVQRFR
ncbi:MAG: FAD-dependent oxidoreductase [Gammaproteobacteria bacterium]|nr:FAD-dependent oxidoreductase [Gammaproteobacteria bacterium]